MQLSGDAVTQTYDVVFNILAQPYQPPWLFITISAIAIAAFAYFELRKPDRGVHIVVVSVLTGVILFMLWEHWNDHRALTQAMITGDVLEIEGQTANFRRDNWPGSAPQTFSVDGVPFYISRWELSAGFRKTTSAGGPDLSDEYVGIHYVGHPRRPHRIVWLAIRRNRHKE